MFLQTIAPNRFVKDKEVERNDIPLPLQIVFDRGNVHFCEEQQIGMLSASDTSSQMLIQLSLFNDHLEAIAKAIKGDR